MKDLLPLHDPLDTMFERRYLYHRGVTAPKFCSTSLPTDLDVMRMAHSHLLRKRISGSQESFAVITGLNNSAEWILDAQIVGVILSHLCDNQCISDPALEPCTPLHVRPPDTLLNHLHLKLTITSHYIVIYGLMRSALT